MAWAERIAKKKKFSRLKRGLSKSRSEEPRLSTLLIAMSRVQSVSTSWRKIEFHELSVC